MKLKRIGVDLAKQVFQLHGVDSHEQPVLRRQLKRGQMMNFFRALEPTLVGMEACGGAHYWARELGKLGHEVKLIAPQFVKPYVKSGKNDASRCGGNLRSGLTSIDAVRGDQESRSAGDAGTASNSCPSGQVAHGLGQRNPRTAR